MTGFVGFPIDDYDHSAEQVGQALAGLVPRGGDGLPKRGWVTAPSVEAVAASWKVEVGRGVYVDHAGGAIVLSGVSAAEQKDVAPATNIPNGQARIDRIAWDVAAGELVVVPGDAAVSPELPSLGALVPVARVRVQAGDSMVVAARVSSDVVVATRWDRYSVYPATGLTVSSSTVCEVDGDEVRLRGRITSPTPILSNTWLATIADGARPAETTPRPAVVSQGGNAGAVFMEIRPNGGIYVWGPPPGNRVLDFDVTYRRAPL